MRFHFSCNVYDLPAGQPANKRRSDWDSASSATSERERKGEGEETAAAAAKANNLSALWDVLEMGGQRFIGTLIYRLRDIFMSVCVCVCMWV